MKRTIQSLGRFIIKIGTVRLNILLRDTPDQEIETWFQNRKVIFIFSLGRSGSMFLADLLNEDPKVTVFHEPTRVDFFAYLNAFYQPALALEYLLGFRKKFIYHLGTRRGVKGYSEVNSILRRHVQAINEGIPGARSIHLVRDGRDVVRSMMARRTYTNRDPITRFIRPREGEAYQEDWSTMSRFEKLCWYWWHENTYLMEHINGFARFEDLIGDYGYFSEYILEPLGIHVPVEIWQKKVEQPKNVTHKHLISHWRDWGEEYKIKFNKICGNLMEKMGYEY
jgi:hypothetical protein